jgi:hypothetical protein
VFVPEDRVLAVLALLRMAAVAPVEVAREVKSPVPAAGRLPEVAAERAHVPELGRGGQAAGFAQGVGDRGRRLQLGERRAGADPSSFDSAREERPDVDELVGADELVADERDEIRAAGERARAVPEARGRVLEARRADE